MATNSNHGGGRKIYMVVGSNTLYQSVVPMINTLAEHNGVSSGYVDYQGNRQDLDDSSRVAVLAALGLDLSNNNAQELLNDSMAAQWCSPLDSVVVIKDGAQLSLRVYLPDGYPTVNLGIQVLLETDGCLSISASNIHVEQIEVREFEHGRFKELAMNVSADIPVGRHTLVLMNTELSEAIAQTRLIVSPLHCYKNPNVTSDARVAGVNLQLYTLRSERNWGMGDFTDLSSFMVEAAAAGVDLVGLNPLHALFTEWPLHFSPYSPSNRAYLNTLYIDPETVGEFRHCAQAQALVQSVTFSEQLAALRAAENVDYQGVSACKLAVLRQLFKTFWEQEYTQQSLRAQQYLHFVGTQGEPLQHHAVYEVLHSYFYRKDNALWGWPVWPEAYRHPNSESVAQFFEAHCYEVHFHQYLQWIAFSQLQAAQHAAVAAGMKVGVYLDLAVGVDAAGSEAWSNQSQFAFGASTGAPPDELAREGQDWGFPPFHPSKLQADGYELFARNIRANMRCAGAVRIDHCVSLYNLWWIPQGHSSANGVYVRYNIDELLGVLALESERNECLVIGEDLGTVPSSLRGSMEQKHIYSYRVLYFEKNTPAGDLTPPEAYPETAVATVTTHDLPTLASWWDMSDLDIRIQLGLIPSGDTERQLRDSRVRDKHALVNALYHGGFLEQAVDVETLTAMTKALTLAVHCYLASSRSTIMMAQIEDWMGMTSPVNIPGTSKDYPNWQRKLAYTIEGFFERPEIEALCAGINKARAS